MVGVMSDADTTTDAAAVPDPRVERTRAHVLAHARELLAEGCPAAVTYTELAARARVTRQTLYRHWPTRAQLFIDLALEAALPELPEPGPPQELLALFLRRLRDGMDDAADAGVLTALIAQADHDPTSASASALQHIVTQVRTTLAGRLDGHPIDAEDYAKLAGPVLFQRFFAREPVSDEFIDELVAAVVPTL
jgi:AcrR family transcriptional regulator